MEPLLPPNLAKRSPILFGRQCPALGEKSELASAHHGVPLPFVSDWFGDWAYYLVLASERSGGTLIG